MSDHEVFMWFIRIEGTLICLGLPFWIPASRRVLVAWAVYVTCRLSPAFRKQSSRRWLWITTLRLANGVSNLPSVPSSPAGR